MARALSPDRRSALRRELACALERSAAADILAGHGHTVLALRLQAEALSLLVDLANRWSGELGASELAALAGRVESALLAPAAADAPERVQPNAEAGPDAAKRFDRLARLTKELSAQVAPFVKPPLVVAVNRGLRIGVPTVVAVVSLAVSVARAGKPRMTASEHFLDWESTEPEKAVDHDPATEWLLNSSRPGWIEARFSRQKLHKISFVNSKNRPEDRRATRDFRIEIYKGSALVKSVDGTAPLTESISWREVPVDVPAADGIRFVVKSWHGSGGGLAELAWQ